MHFHSINWSVYWLQYTNNSHTVIAFVSYAAVIVVEYLYISILKQFCILEHCGVLFGSAGSSRLFFIPFQIFRILKNVKPILFSEWGFQRNSFGYINILAEWRYNTISFKPRVRIWCRAVITHALSTWKKFEFFQHSQNVDCRPLASQI